MRHTKQCRCAWELLCQIGYEPGTGLGKRKQGMRCPISVGEVRKREGLGCPIEQDEECRIGILFSPNQARPWITFVKGPTYKIVVFRSRMGRAHIAGIRTTPYNAFEALRPGSQIWKRKD